MRVQGRACGGAGRVPDECHDSLQGRRKTGEIRRPRGAPRQNPSPSVALAAAAPAGRHESRRGRPEQARGVALARSCGRGFLLRSESRQLSSPPATEAPEGEMGRRSPSPLGGLAARSVSLGQPRGSSPTGVSREPARETEIRRNPSPSAHFAAKSVSLGGSRGECAKAVRTRTLRSAIL